MTNQEKIEKLLKEQAAERNRLRLEIWHDEMLNKTQKSKSKYVRSI